MPDSLTSLDSLSIPDRLAFLEAVHEAVPTMVAVVECGTGACAYLDPSVEQHLGYTAREMALGGPAFLAGLLHPDDRERADIFGPLPASGDAPDGKQAAADRLEFRLRHKDGLWRWFRARRTVFERGPEGGPVRLLVVFQDITERKRAEERTLQAEERFRAVMQHSQDIVNILDADGRLIYSSPAGEQIHGFAATESLGASLYPQVHPEDLQAVRQAFAKILAQPDRPRTIRYRLASRNRGWVWVETVAVNQLKNPAIRGILCNIRDISDRKRAEANLLRSEALLAEAQHLAALGSFEVDLRSKTSIWSEGMYRLLDRDIGLGPMRYQELVELIHPADRRNWTSARKRLYADSVPLRSEFRVIWRDRSVHHLSVKARPVEGGNGSFLKIVGAIQDISERKRSEDALRDSMNAYREAADFLPQTVFEMDVTGRLTFLNRMGFQAFNYTEEDFERGLQAPQMLAPGDRARAAWSITQAMAREHYSHEFDALRKDGSTFPVIIHASPIIREGRAVGLRGILVDITERKKAEEEREWLQERLRHSEKMEAIGQLAGGIAHDFNNHLSAILGFAEILLERMADPEQVPFLDGIIKSSRRSAELTRQLLAFARKGKFLTVLVDLQEVIEEVVQILKHSIDKRIVLRRVTDGRPALVLGDPCELQNTLMNLAINARDAMPDGGEMTFSTRVRQLDEATCRRLASDVLPGTFLEVSVSDTGMGIERDIQQRIFEPFFTTKELGKGTGLGLASVYGTMKNHRGAIMVTSEPGHGSCFKLFLPLAQLRDGEAVESVETRTGIQSLDIPPGSGQILVIEDEALVGQMLLVMLGHLGFKATLMQDGRAALDHFGAIWRTVDLVIMDLVMPNLSGLETFRGLKAISPDVPVVVSSGYGADGEAQQIMDEGATAFLQKPYQVRELSQVLARVFPSQVV